MIKIKGKNTRQKCTILENKSCEKYFPFEKLKERKHWLDLEADKTKTVLKSIERKVQVGSPSQGEICSTKLIVYFIVTMNSNISILQ
jgi:hypothetical protein